MKNPRILVLTSNRANRHLLEGWLSKSYQVISASGDNVLDVPFDMAILDASVLTSLKREAQTRRERERPVFLPFLLFTPRVNAVLAARYLGRLVDELILTPIEMIELRARVNNLLQLRQLSLELREQYRAVKQLSVTDDVSGFHNTRFLHQYLDELLSRPGAVVSLVFSDMDRFKSVVDTHGHLLGAKVLREAAQVFHRHLDPEDRIVRYGGDEYVIILPGQRKKEALAKVERLRQGLLAEAFLKQEGIRLHITASLGLATYPDDAQDKRALLAAADRCLFQSKERGKNRITVTNDPAPPTKPGRAP
ncbi:MAG: diguanylate cyclase [Verrucomicrobia bacterium]|nr:diguanylate cyclase [Verrucomicrobiota bacterium]